ncbi:MAG: phosphatidate cytidylyltransferase [bacterium]|nr:phosphatidate cytidylyltransferase [bacterium]
MHLQRVTSAFLAFLVTLLVLWAGLPLLGPVYLVLTAIAIQEYATMMALRGVPVRRRSLWVISALTLPASLPAGHPWMVELGGVPWRELLLVGFVLYLLVAEVATSNRSSLHSLVFTLFGYVWISWGFGLIITLRYTPDGVVGLWYLAFPMLAIIATDVGGYVFGSLWGKRPLAPRISPKKTVEGLIGGLLLALVVLGTTMALLPRWTDFRLDLAHLLVFGLAVPLAALAGDLFESLVKRWAGVKDTGVFLPGHGGVLDRIDSTLIAVPVTYLLVTLLLL